MKSAVFAGSFDPVTVGHIEIVRRLSGVFDHVYFLLAVNAEKTCYFPENDRLEMMRLAVTDIPKVTVDVTHGYVYAYAAAHDAVLARGVRNDRDFAYERMIADNNHGWAPDIETIFLMADPSLRTISSTEIRERFLTGETLNGFVPDGIAQYLEEGRGRFGKQ